GTLLMDLFTAREEARDAVTAEMRFDIDLLADRLVDAWRYTRASSGLNKLAVGFFGASTGAAAALVAAARIGEELRAVVSRSGRTDLAGTALPHVRAATLLLAGSLEPEVVALNRASLAEMETTKKLVVVPGASRTFQEPGALQHVARLASGWFQIHLPA
ncbi:MAG TPA: alpha/beta hydrolase, partial [Thermoanaerobaculia bacterium]|nr:alpha/beta hydrolase [Thermoanaerobaculia bacterium]